MSTSISPALKDEHAFPWRAHRMKAQVIPFSNPRHTAAHVSAEARKLPHSLEAEEGLLSLCFLDGASMVDRCIEARIGPESFYDTKHAIVFALMIDLHSRKTPIDIGVVAEELKASGQLDKIGGFAFLEEVSRKMPTSALAGYFIEKVGELARRRELIIAANNVAEDAHDLTTGIDDLLSRCLNRVGAVASASGVKQRGFPVWSLDDFARHVPAADTAIMGEDSGVQYWHDRELALLLGPGGVGKSRLNLQLALSQILQREFIGFKTYGPPRRWLLMGNENSVDRYKHELDRMLRGSTEDERRLVSDNLRLQALVDDSADSMSLDDPASIARWRATAQAHKPDVLSVDPWEAVIIGGDCIDAGATRESVRLLRGIFSPHNPRFSLLIVHHAREGAEAARKAEGFDAGSFAKGSKTLRSMARFGINVAPEDPDDGARVVLACGKINNAKKFSTRGAVMDEETYRYSLNPDFDLVAWREDVDGKHGKSCSIRDVVDAVRAGSTKTGEIVHRVHQETGACTRTVKTRIGDAVAGGYLKGGTSRGLYVLGPRKL